MTLLVAEFVLSDSQTARSSVSTYLRPISVIALIFELSVGKFIAAWVIYGTSSIKNNWSRCASRLRELVSAKLIKLILAPGIPHLIHIPFSTFMLFAVLILPESPRRHMSKSRPDEARAFLLQYHANGAMEDPLVAFELQEIRTEEVYYSPLSDLTFTAQRANLNSKGLTTRIPGARCLGLAGTDTDWTVVSVYLTNRSLISDEDEFSACLIGKRGEPLPLARSSLSTSK